MAYGFTAPFYTLGTSYSAHVTCVRLLGAVRLTLTLGVTLSLSAQATRTTRDQTAGGRTGAGPDRTRRTAREAWMVVARPAPWCLVHVVDSHIADPMTIRFGEFDSGKPSH